MVIGEGHSSNVVYLVESELAVPEPTDEGYVELRLEMPDFAKDWSDEQSAGMCVWSLGLFKGNSDAPCPHKAIWGVWCVRGKVKCMDVDDAGC